MMDTLFFGDTGGTSEDYVRVRPPAGKRADLNLSAMDCRKKPEYFRYSARGALNLGSFEELPKTIGPKQPLQEYARQFLVDRILAAAGTPTGIAGTLEELHFVTDATASFSAAMPQWTTSGNSSNTSFLSRGGADSAR